MRDKVSLCIVLNMQEVRPITDLVPEAYIALIILLGLALGIAVAADSSGETRDLIREAFWIVWVSPLALFHLWMRWSQINPYQGRHRA